MKKLVLILLLNLICIHLHATAFYSKKYEGWFWFEDPKKQAQKTEETDKEEPLFPLSTLSPLEQMEAMQHRLKEAKARAIIEPNITNLLAYQRLQHKIFNQAERFAKIGQKVLLVDPSLDSNITNPTAQIARPVIYQMKAAQRTQKLKALSNRYGLFFFFSSECQICHVFAPILKKFQEKYDWNILAISTDGKGLKEFPDFKIDNGLGQKIQYFPALMLFDAETQNLIPFHYGFATLDMLEEKVDLFNPIGVEKS